LTERLLVLVLKTGFAELDDCGPDFLPETGSLR
jgi:hypothetical protein